MYNRPEALFMVFNLESFWLKRLPRLFQKFDHVYAMAAAGFSHSLLLRNDGQTVAFGSNGDQQCNIPALPAGVHYVDCAAGVHHSILLRNDGQAVAFGRDDHQRCNIPALPVGRRYSDPFARLDPRFVRSLMLGAVGGSLPPLEVLARVVSFLTRRVVVD